MTTNAYLRPLALGLLICSHSFAETVRVPLEVDRHFVELVVREQIFNGPDHSVRINGDGTGCQYLELMRPRVSIEGGLVRIRADALARTGRRVGQDCLLLLNWRGQLEFDQRPAIERNASGVVLRTESWRALTPDGRIDTVSTAVGQWLERLQPPGLRQTRISLAEPLSQLKQFLAALGSPTHAEAIRALLDSVSVVAVVADDQRLTLALQMEATAEPPRRAATEPVLSEAEIVRLEARLDELDAFFTHAIKKLTGGPVDQHDADALFALLLELRYEIVGILSEPARRERDPVRALFATTWERLTPLLHEMGRRQPDHAGAVRYLTFIGAGDILSALDQLGPATGIDVSTDGLRRFARILIPADAGDPLRRDDDVDPELRRSFGFGPPLPPPASGVDTSWIDWLLAPAAAAQGLDPALVRKLNNWVPTQTDMPTYLPMVREVLRHVVAEKLRDIEIQRIFRNVFHDLVFTTAWQESCWRQFVARSNQRMPLQSGSGDIGIMQINPRVWRGFYDQHGLKWDIVYNARAGADILARYMIRLALGNNEHEKTGRLDSLARSAYAAYNGGPRQYDRYRRSDATQRERTIDRLFYEKFRIVNSGSELPVQACYTAQ